MRNHALVIDFNRQLGGELCDIVFLYNFHFFFTYTNELNFIDKSVIGTFIEKKHQYNYPLCCLYGY